VAVITVDVVSARPMIIGGAAGISHDRCVSARNDIQGAWIA
jgi:hypothetical protein